MKKNLPFILIGLAILVVVIGGGAFAVSRSNGNNAEVTPTPTKKKVSKPANVIPFEERPYVVMAPTIGREIDVTVYALNKPADGVEYLAEYQYGTSLGGNEQFIDLGEGLPAKQQFALYSRSAGGKTSYEEDVQGGTLTMDFQGAEEYRVEQPWKYIDNKTKSDTFAMKDGSFEISGAELKNVRYAILYNSPGTPKALPGEKASEVYTVSLTSSVKSIDVAIKADGGTIYGWTGTDWKEFESSTSNGMVTATADLAQAYVVVK